jgi:HD-GYP domain-containing protein (c-di-GMP phosphodiesterase class II)
MRLVATSSLKENIKLAKPILNESGQILIQQGIPLTTRIINRLIGIGITFVYVQDEATSGLELKQVISEQTRIKSVNIIKNEFVSIADEMKLKKSFNGDRLSKNFSNIITNILNEIKQNKEALSILSDVFIYDNYIFSHSLNVTVYTLGLALELNFTEKQTMEIGLGAILHDVGKMLTPTDILNKPGRLTSEEFEIVKMHTTDGFKLLKDLPNISLLVAHCAFQHHERLNGTGYPRGLTEAEIHLYAKIIGVCDVFDAVTSNRVYRKAMLPHEGLDLLYSGVGTLYSEDMIRAFQKTIAIYPDGLMIGLSDGRKGVVVKQNKELSTRPIIRILREKDTDVVPYEVDLIKEINVTIIECEARLADTPKDAV